MIERRDHGPDRLARDQRAGRVVDQHPFGGKRHERLEPGTDRVRPLGPARHHEIGLRLDPWMTADLLLAQHEAYRTEPREGRDAAGENRPAPKVAPLLGHAATRAKAATRRDEDYGRATQGRLRGNG